MYPLPAWHSPALGTLGPKPQPLPGVSEGRVQRSRVFVCAQAARPREREGAERGVVCVSG